MQEGGRLLADVLQPLLRPQRTAKQPVAEPNAQVYRFLGTVSETPSQKARKLQDVSRSKFEKEVSEEEIKKKPP